MPIEVRHRAERSYVVRRVLRRLRALAGGVLLFVASLTAMSVVLMPIAWLVARSSDDDSSLSPERRDEIVGALGRGSVLVVVITIAGWTTGRYLLRSRRGTVLWLRRFRHDEATRVVSSALDYIGRSWRVVTLDDAETESVGVAPALRVTDRVVTAIKRVVPRVGRVLAVTAKVLAVMCVVAIVAVVGWSIYDGTFGDTMEAAFGQGTPSDQPEAMVLVVLLLVLVGEFFALIAVVVLLLCLIPLLGVTVLAGNLRRNIEDAEDAKQRFVRSAADVDAAARSVATTGSELVAPRLTVMTVDSTVWQETVAALVRTASAVIVDVSVVTENLLWEVDHVTHNADARVLFVGERQGLARIDDSAADTDDATSPHWRRLSELLDGRRVLAYTTTFLGRIRFQRALFGELEATRSKMPVEASRIRRGVLAFAGFAVFAFGTVAAVSLLADQF